MRRWWQSRSSKAKEPPRPLRILYLPPVAGRPPHYHGVYAETKADILEFHEDFADPHLFFGALFFSGDQPEWYWDLVEAVLRHPDCPNAATMALLNIMPTAMLIAGTAQHDPVRPWRLERYVRAMEIICDRDRHDGFDATTLSDFGNARRANLLADCEQKIEWLAEEGLRPAFPVPRATIAAEPTGSAPRPVFTIDSNGLGRQLTEEEAVGFGFRPPR